MPRVLRKYCWTVAQAVKITAMFKVDMHIHSELGGSDAHGPVTVGRAYTVFDRAIDTMDDLVAALKSGDYHAGFRTPY